MSFDLLSTIALVLGIVLSADRVFQFFARGRYSTKEEILSMEKAFNTTQLAQGARIVEAHHRVDLLFKHVEGMPSYTHVNELKKELNDLAREVAVNNARLENIGQDVHQIRATIERASAAFEGNR